MALTATQRPRLLQNESFFCFIHLQDWVLLLTHKPARTSKITRLSNATGDYPLQPAEKTIYNIEGSHSATQLILQFHSSKHTIQQQMRLEHARTTKLGGVTW